MAGRHHLPADPSLHLVPTDNPPNLAMMDMVHRAFERDINRLAAVVAERPTDPARVEAISTSWDLFYTLLENHHRAEDEALWPVLIEVHPPAAAVVLDMEQQHATLDLLLKDADYSMREWRADPGDPQKADGAAADLRDIATFAPRHLAEEESRALPLVAEYLTADQWAGFTGYNMQLNAGTQATMSWLAEGKPADVRAMIWSFVPEEIRLGPAVEWSADYDRMIATAFAVETPTSGPL